MTKPIFLQMFCLFISRFGGFIKKMNHKVTVQLIIGNVLNYYAYLFLVTTRRLTYRRALTTD